MTNANRKPWTHLARGPWCYGWGMTVEEALENAAQRLPGNYTREDVEVWEIPEETEVRISTMDGTISWTGPDPVKVREAAAR